MRFRAEQHLRRPTEIRAVREQGQRVDCRAFTLWWKHRDTPPPVPSEKPEKPRTELSAISLGPRVCVVASGAAVGNAVLRNRAKRRLRELFRHQQGAVPKDCDLLLVARRAVIDCPMPNLEKNFAEVCRRIEPGAQKR